VPRLLTALAAYAPAMGQMTTLAKAIVWTVLITLAIVLTVEHWWLYALAVLAGYWWLTWGWNAKPKQRQ
jgi:hypothetical protein